MADNFFRASRGLSLNPRTSIPSNPASGDVYYDSTMNTFVMYDNGSWINLASRADIASAATLNSANFTAAVVQNSLVRITGSTASDLDGLTASTDGKTVLVYNSSSANITVHDNNVGEPTAANRISTAAAVDITVTPGQSISFAYDGGQSRWIVASTSASSGNSSAGLAGEVTTGVNATSRNINFISPLPNNTYVTETQFVNTFDSNPDFQPITVTSKTTFGFVASWNAPISSGNYFIDWIVAGILSLSQSGHVAIVNGNSSVTVTFPSAFGSTSYAVIVNLVNTLDMHPDFQPITITNKTTTSFTATWNVPVDTGNYSLDWEAAPYT